MREFGTEEVERAEGVHGHDAVELGKGDVADGTGGKAEGGPDYAGHVYGGVERPELEINGFAFGGDGGVMGRSFRKGIWL